jgi:hypothetical protein
MSILGPDRKYSGGRSHHDLTADQVDAAWRAAYRTSLDDTPDVEVAWEARIWRAWGVESVAAIADAVLAERRESDLTIPGAAEPAGLDKLLASVELRPVLRLCRDEGLCLLAASRLVFWSGLREVQP